MKQTILRTLSLLTLLIAGAFATVQAQPVTRFTVDVPFAFTVNTEAFPAGRYEILLREKGQADHFRIVSQETKKSLAVFPLPKEGRTYSDETKLIFRRYGNRHFLGEVWTRGESIGHELLRSKDEKKLRTPSRKEGFTVTSTGTGQSSY